MQERAKFFALAGTALCLACSQARPPAARRPWAVVYGDVYLVMQNGDVKRGAGNVVVLVADTAPLHAAVARLCEMRTRHVDSLLSRVERAKRAAAGATYQDDEDRLLALAYHLQDSVEAIRTTPISVAAVVAPFAKAASPTGVNAAYQIAGVIPGRYVLWASTQISDHHYDWWAPVVVAATDSVRRDLDNSVATEKLADCKAGERAAETN
jgi:hypothetical protein